MNNLEGPLGGVKILIEALRKERERDELILVRGPESLANYFPLAYIGIDCVSRLPERIPKVPDRWRKALADCQRTLRIDPTAYVTDVQQNLLFFFRLNCDLQLHFLVKSKWDPRFKIVIQGLPKGARNREKMQMFNLAMQIEADLLRAYTDLCSFLFYSRAPEWFSLLVQEMQIDALHHILVDSEKALSRKREKDDIRDEKRRFINQLAEFVNPMDDADREYMPHLCQLFDEGCRAASENQSFNKSHWIPFLRAWRRSVNSHASPAYRRLVVEDGCLFLQGQGRYKQALKTDLAKE